MIKQLHVVSNIALSSGGVGLAALRFSEAVAKAGAKVTLLCSSKGNQQIFQPSGNIENFECIEYGFSGGFSRTIVQQYKWIDEFCANQRPDILHLHSAWLPFLTVAAAIASKWEIPYFISPHGCYEPWALNYKRFKKKIALSTYQGMVNRSAAGFFATAGQEVASIRRLGLVQPVAVLPNGIDIIDPPHKVLPEGKRIILFLSRIHPKKGLLDLVEAWAKIRDPNWRIMVAGPDENGHLFEVKAAIAAHGLGGDFEFVGMVDGEKKSGCFQCAELFILPTYSENYGIAVAEALAYGLPVITTTGAPWEDLVTYNCGWWVTPGVTGISAALEAAVKTDAGDLRLMGQRGRDLVIDKCSWDSIGATALEVGSWILNQELTKPVAIRT